MIRGFALFKCSLLLGLGIVVLSCLIAGVYYRTTVVNLFAYQYWRLFSTSDSTSAYVTNRGASIYYETHGKGRPLVLLHGGLTSIEAFFGQLPSLSKNFKIVVIDLRGQGRSSMGDEELSYRLMASDVLAVLDQLQFATVDLVGWSDGGIVGLRIGLQQPDRIRRLMVLGTNFKPEGLALEVRESLHNTDASQASLWTRMLHRLRSPEPARWQELWGKVRTMWLTRPDLTVDDLAKIDADVLVVMGEYDYIELQHTREMAAAINGAELIVIPQAGHGLLIEEPQKILQLMLTFMSPDK